MLSPVRDLIFKKIFKINIACTIDMLNSLLGLHDGNGITDLTVADNEYLGDNDNTNSTVLDLHCILSNDTHIIVEVCRYTMRGNSFLNRIQIYSSEVFLDTWKKSRTTIRGDRYLHGIYPVTTIVLVDFRYDFLEQFRSPNGIHHFGMCHVESRNFSTQFLQEYIFVDLSRVRSCLSIEDDRNMYEDNLKGWLMLLTCKDEEIVQVQQLGGGVISLTIRDTNITTTTTQTAALKNAFVIASQLNEDERQQLRIEDDRRATLDSVINRVSFEEGIERGKQEERLHLAKRLKRQNFDIETISDLTNLSHDEVRNISL